jgi:death-on-curing protein
VDDVIFLNLNDVLRIHADMIAAYGGDEAVLDIGLVESAIAQPHASFGGNYLHKDIASMAAA